MQDHVAHPDPAARIAREYWHFLTLGLLLFSLYLMSRHSYLLFHGLAEVFSFVVAYGIFILTWNSRRHLDNGFFLFVGIASLCVGVVDLVHMLAYKGMNVFPGRDANLPTQLWIAARYLQALAFLMATALIGSRFRAAPVLAAGAAVTVLALAVVWTGMFPDCYVEGAGLTSFKIASEYLIALLFLASGANLIRRRDAFDAQTVRVLLMSLGLGVAAELCFTAYLSVFGYANLVGHLLRLASSITMACAGTPRSCKKTAMARASEKAWRSRSPPPLSSTSGALPA